MTRTTCSTPRIQEGTKSKTRIFSFIAGFCPRIFHKTCLIPVFVTYAIPFLPIVFLNGAFYFNVSSNCSFKVIAISCLLCILPFLPNHQVISTTASLASVCVTIFNFIEQCKIWVAAKRRRSAITSGTIFIFFGDPSFVVVFIAVVAAT